MNALDHLNHAARLALRGHGGAEPNPMVGCVITDANGSLVGWGFHRRIGSLHAEREAIKVAGIKARGGTAYVTLEPCNRTGRTPPCTQGLIEAGIKRVVFAQKDPHAAATGSEATLREAGIEVEHMPHAALACRVAAPFVRRVTTGLPFVIAKWAQSRDGRLAMPVGADRWISGERSRRMVHRERGRVDAVLTGIGTVLADDPLLTVRHGRKRRTPRRIVIDPRLRMPDQCQLLASIDEAPLTIVCSDAAESSRINSLKERGAEVLAFPAENSRLVLADVLRDLAQRDDMTNILVEAGPGLLSLLFLENLVDMMWVFIAPMELRDAALPAMPDASPANIAAARGMELLDERTRGEDIMQLYGRTSTRP